MKKVCGLIMLLIVLGCSNNKERVIRHLTSEVLGVNNYLGRASFMEILDHYLILRDDHEKTAYTIFNLGQDSITPVYFGHKGDGPGELINPGAIVCDSNIFHIYDGSYRKLFPFYIDSVQNNTYRPKSGVSVSKDEVIMDIKRISKDKFVSVGIYADNRFVFLDNNGEVIHKIGDYPIEDNNIPPYVKSCACISWLTTNPNENLMVSCMLYAEDIRFYRVLDNCDIELLNVHSSFLPEFTTKDIGGTPNFSPTQNTRWGYLSLTSNNDYVYALYSGKYQRDGVDFYQANVVHVFDWDGKLISEILLDKEVQSIATNQEYLFALYEGEDGYDIAKYKL